MDLRKFLYIWNQDQNKEAQTMAVKRGLPEFYGSFVVIWV